MLPRSQLKESMTSSFDGSVARGYERLNRRGFIGRGAMALGGLALSPALLGACARGEELVATETTVGSLKDVVATHSIRWSNWPAYIDQASANVEGTSTLDDFTEATGISVVYSEAITDNEQYFASISEQLRDGLDVGADTFIVSNHMVGRLISLGYLAPIDTNLIPNARANLAFGPSPIDPDRAFSLPYFGGFISIAYNTALTGREITSINDLFDPAFAGNVTMFSDLRDGLGLVIRGMGGSLKNVDLAVVQAAADKVKVAKDAGQFRAFTGNEYFTDLAAGNTAISMCYSGDIAQIQRVNPDIAFVVPDEGMLSFADNWVVPITVSAEAHAAVNQLIDFYYDPVVSAKLTNQVQYISPVSGVGPELEKLDPEVAGNPLINPPQSWLDASTDWRVLSDEEDSQFSAVYQAAITG